MAPASSCPSGPTGRHAEACREIFVNRDQPKRLVRALASRVLKERQGIKESYRALYGEELVDRLLGVKAANPESEQVCTGLWLWMMEQPERDAVLAKDAVKWGGADGYKALVEIYVRRKPSHLLLSKQAYFIKFRRHLDNDVISSDHPGSKILAALAASHKSHPDEVSKHIGNCDAKRLNEALKGSEGGINGSSTVIEIFSKRSIPQLKLAFSSYMHIYGQDYMEALETRTGEFEESLRAALQCMNTPHTYYSEETEKTTLTRVMMGGAEAGMSGVRNAYERKFGAKLEDDIARRVHGDESYRDFLLALANSLESD